MHLRRLYLTKRGLLALERKELVSSIASFDNQLLHPSDYAAMAADVADRLKESAFADQQVLYRIARAVWCGVCSCFMTDVQAVSHVVCTIIGQMAVMMSCMIGGWRC